MTIKYPYSVFYFTKSVYDTAGENLTCIQAKLLLKAVLINIRFKGRIGTHITFTTKQIFELVKSVEYAHFKGFMALGTNMALPEDSTTITGNKDFRLIQFAISKDGDVEGVVKIVVDDKLTRDNLSKIIQEDNYPLELVNSEEALTELQEIEIKLLKEYP